MKKSINRILTTHVGSLPRCEELSQLLIEQERENLTSHEILNREIEKGMERVITKQLMAGIDIGNDGEQYRVGFQTYIPQRIQGFSGESKRQLSIELSEFPDYTVPLLQKKFPRGKIANCPHCTAMLNYQPNPCTEECEMFIRAMKKSPLQFTQTFMTAPSPGIIATTMHNEFYDTYENYLFSLADQIRQEYELIHAHGFLLQIDAPDLLMERHMEFHNLSLSEYRKRAELHVEAINRALTNIPRDDVRLHTCWGNYEGPHIFDVELKDIIDIVYQAKVGAISIALANPRHQHEYKIFKDYPLPDSMILIPGVIDTTTCYVEHPELIADRICLAIQTVGDPSLIIAGCDCGFETFVDWAMVPESIVWKKLEALSEGAKIATKRIWPLGQHNISQI
ncbi:2-hydroxypropyl-CoM lyase [Legionella donaldsonii]|uniref:2-hydroxypropyl-CoM lyase n=1 Tax=Legionella donaldsonii TaxID=45060 RepID=A0A378KKN4_9GAMM|nr:methionine synthase [Legionella donaldsonii]STX84900.1 2-hydroxypropyl-CoM lyase [Legionella donaldsonii]